MVGRAARRDEVLVFDLDHHEGVTGQGIGLSVEASTESRELDPCSLKRTVREEVVP
jgi:hypothetical protein